MLNSYLGKVKKIVGQQLQWFLRYVKKWRGACNRVKYVALIKMEAKSEDRFKRLQFCNQISTLFPLQVLLGKPQKVLFFVLKQPETDFFLNKFWKKSAIFQANISRNLLKAHEFFPPTTYTQYIYCRPLKKLFFSAFLTHT